MSWIIVYDKRNQMIGKSSNGIVTGFFVERCRMIIRSAIQLAEG